VYIPPGICHKDMTTAWAVAVNNNRVIALLALRQYWERLFSRLRPSRNGGQRAFAREESGRELSDITAENRVLAEEVRKVRSEFELARVEDRRKLAELESINDQYATVREADHRQISELEDRLAGLEAERSQTRDRVQALENSLADASTRLEQTDRQIKELESRSLEQAQQFDASLSDTSNRLEATDNQVKILGIRLENEHQQILKTFQEMQGRLRKQDTRMNWILIVAGFALLLGTGAAVVLIWDVQKNSTLLAGMSRDIRELTATVNGQSSLQHSPGLGQRHTERSAASPDDRAAVTGNPANSSAVTMPPVSPATATDKAAPGPDFPDDAADSVRSVTRLGIQQATREDAKRFFEDNAANADMISLPSGVQYRVIKAGNGRSPSLSDQVVVSYVGMEPEGKVFDETYSTGAPETFSMNELMPGWREVLLKMQEGAEFELYVPPSLAASGSVRKRSMLGYEPSIYLIELLQVINTSSADPSAPAR
jgi:FKBP-type peptidyl-prolyl cis-trans isomerase